MQSLVERLTVPAAAPLVPEITLRLARDATGIFEATAAAMTVRGLPACPAYWAFAWPGGQAAARHVLDHPDLVAGRRVVDIGAGSGLAALAAARAGAADVLAADIDPLAEAAIALNAAANGVALRSTTDDVLALPPDAEIAILGDLVYEPEMAVRASAFVEAALAAGVEIWLADRVPSTRLSVGPARRGRGAPAIDFALMAEYHAPLVPALPAHPFERARLWRLTMRTQAVSRL